LIYSVKEEDIERIMVISGGYRMIELDTKYIDEFEEWIENMDEELVSRTLLLVKVDTKSYHYNEDTYEVFSDNLEKVVYIVGNFVMYHQDFNRTRFLNLLENHNVNILYTDNNGEYKVSRLYCTTQPNIGNDYIERISSLFPDVVALFRSKVMSCK
jgi:hypothetical protein